MKFTILLSSAILFATALTPISAYADDSNLSCHRSGNGCDTRPGGGNERISISGFDIEVKSSDRGNRNRNTADRNTGNRNTAAKGKTNDNLGKGNDDTVSAAGADHADADDTDNAEIGNDVADNTDTGNDNDDAGDNNDTGASNNSPPQLNSNDIKGFDPFGGLYGPGT
jgi:hypothetical protein